MMKSISMGAVIAVTIAYLVAAFVQADWILPSIMTWEPRQRAGLLWAAGMIAVLGGTIGWVIWDTRHFRV